MKTNNKILIIFFSALILVGAGYMIHLQQFKLPLMEESYEFEYGMYKNEIIPDYFENLQVSKNKGNARYSPANSASLTESMKGSKNLLDEIVYNKTQPASRSKSNLNFGTYTYKPNSKSANDVVAGAGGFTGGLFAYGGRSSSMESAMDNVSGATSASYSRPLLVPFSNNFIGTPTTESGTILFDPGADPDDIETTTIPVGDGGWVLLLLGIIYLVVKRYFFGTKGL